MAYSVTMRTNWIWLRCFRIRPRIESKVAREIGVSRACHLYNLTPAKERAMPKATFDPSTKAAILKLLRRGVVTVPEAARISGLSRQIVHHWVRGEDLAGARAAYLARLWAKSISRG
jgi:hypothetical protein